MIKFEKLLERSSVFDFKFVNQRVVRFVGLYDDRVVSYGLTKSDVIKAIKSYIDTIHHFSDKPIRGEGMNFVAFKMYDLVPYFYTLLNLLMSVSANSDVYYRFLPELKLTRFCHMPFENEIIEVPKKDLRIEYVKVRDNVRGSYRYLSYVDSYTFCSDTLDNLISSVRVTAPYLFNDYNVRFESIL